MLQTGRTVSLWPPSWPVACPLAACPYLPRRVLPGQVYSLTAKTPCSVTMHMTFLLRIQAPLHCYTNVMRFECAQYSLKLSFSIKTPNSTCHGCRAMRTNGVRNALQVQCRSTAKAKATWQGCLQMGRPRIKRPKSPSRPMEACPSSCMKPR